MENDSPWKTNSLKAVIDALRRQRVRQGDIKPALDNIIAQAIVLKKLQISDGVSQVASEMASRAQELRGSHYSLPKFVVEDLLEESIARLEGASLPPAGTSNR